MVFDDQRIHFYILSNFYHSARNFHNVRCVRSVDRISYLVIVMKVTAAILKNANSKGAAIFRKILDDKNTVRPHLKTGGKISDLKDKFNLAKIASIKKV